MTLKDIFDLKLPDILQLEGFKAKSASNLYKEIASARKVTDFQLLAALNIANVGANIAKKIMHEYTLAELRSMSTGEMENINTIGPERAKALHDHLAEQSKFIDELLAALEVTQTKGQTEKILPTVCFTGKMPEKRSYYEHLATQNGYETTSTVSKELSLLVALDPAAGGGKLTKAQKAGVEITALNDWLQKINTPNARVIPKDDLFADSPKNKKKEQGTLF